ncbi:SRPBCC family protein [Gordonia soli]|uniref:Coenzyme Q-binding protein COQ10 START domain-containing protein n=1 Tax=Gordonia soli NBRC 108243 TaxID=1223545 RepID=M0QHX1_9ACTN|nr:SRPBCC family protein [Gordonia soli]GAC68235.1 hypothetical protein GS4_14_00660 [Gordonia soli NBRC 108243]
MAGRKPRVLHHTGHSPIDRAQAFDYVTDHRTIPNWFYALREFEPVTDHTRGLGARFDARMVIGPTSVASTVEITEWIEGERIRLTSVDGLSTDSTWTFADTDADGTELTVQFSYALPGGLAGRALATIIEPVVGQAIRHTDATLRKQLRDLTA